MKKRRSIAHFTGREQYALRHIKNRIAAELDPLLIYHIDTTFSSHLQRSAFWSKRTMEQWHYNVRLLLIFEDGIAVNEDRLQQFVKALGSNIGLTIIQCGFTQMKEQLASGNLFFTWIHKKGIVLFNRNATLERIPPTDISVRKYAAQAQEWYKNDPTLTTAFVQLLHQPAPIHREA